MRKLKQLFREVIISILILAGVAGVVWAAINANQIGNGSVSNLEFYFLNGLQTKTGSDTEFLRADGLWKVPAGGGGVTGNGTAGKMTMFTGTSAIGDSSITDTQAARILDLEATDTPTFANVLLSNLTASKAVVTDGSKQLASSAVTSTELGYVSGVTSAIQTQINDKAPTASPTFTGIVAAPTINLTGGQIAFPAAQSASANANTLDDYEEGTWTPGVSFGGGEIGNVYNEEYTKGFYTKIGNIVTVSGFMMLTTKGSSTGGADITGLPFVVKNDNAAYSATSLQFSAITFVGQFAGYVRINLQTIALEQETEAGVKSSLIQTNFANGSWIIVTTTYRVN